MRLLIRIVAVLIGAWLGFYALSAGFGQVGQSSNGHSGSTVHGGSYWPLGVLAFAVVVGLVVLVFRATRVQR
jgi:hypothetical protein